MDRKRCCGKLFFSRKNKEREWRKVKGPKNRKERRFTYSP